MIGKKVKSAGEQGYVFAPYIIEDAVVYVDPYFKPKPGIFTRYSYTAQSWSIKIRREEILKDLLDDN